MDRLIIQNVSKTFPGGLRALDDVSFSVGPGEFFSVLGPTNAGKSTLLKLIAGLVDASAGLVALDGTDVTRLEPRLRKVSLLFQNIALFPTASGFDNIAYPLRLAGVDETEIRRRVDEVAALVNVRHLLDRLPRTYSGGEQQRVAIARALALRSRLLMLDEPLTNLDARLRISLRREFKALHRDSGQTIIYVTHDQVEAMSLSDRILVLNQGRIEQIGTPQEIYHRPATRFVSEFIGTPPMNVIDCAVSNGGRSLTLADSDVTIPVDPAMAAALPDQVAVGIRPEDVIVAPQAGEAAGLPGNVVWIERLGSRNVLDFRIGRHAARAVVPVDHPVNTTGTAWFGFPAGRRHVVDRATNRFVRPASS